AALGRAQYAAARKRDDNSAKYAADAKATFAEAVKRWPGEKIFWAFLSEIADFNNDAAGGEAVVKEMIARPEFQESPEPTMMLAGARDKAGAKSEKFAQAEKLLRNLLAASPNDAQLHALLGVVLQNENKEDQALESLSTALSIDPKNQAALFARGSLRLRGKA